MTSSFIICKTCLVRSSVHFSINETVIVSDFIFLVMKLNDEINTIFNHSLQLYLEWFNLRIQIFTLIIEVRACFELLHSCNKNVYLHLYRLGYDSPSAWRQAIAGCARGLWKSLANIQGKNRISRVFKNKSSWGTRKIHDDSMTPTELLALCKGIPPDTPLPVVPPAKGENRELLVFSLLIY